jgi:hypothetical protein
MKIKLSKKISFPIRKLFYIVRIDSVGYTYVCETEDTTLLDLLDSSYLILDKKQYKRLRRSIKNKANLLKRLFSPKCITCKKLRDEIR